MTINKVNLEAVGHLIDTIKGDENKKNTKWHSEVIWKGGFASEAKSRHFSPTPSDEPKGLGGEDLAPNPVEQLLGALGNCLAVGYAANASVLGVKIDDLKISLEGDLDLKPFLGLEQGHAGFSKINVNVDLKTNAESELVKQLHEKVQGSSPVGHSLANLVSVNYN